MINPLQPAIPTHPNLSDIDRLITMMTFIGDVEACKARFAELSQLAGESAAVVAQADKLRAEIAMERDAIKAEQAKQDKSLSDARAAFERDCKARDRAIKDRLEEAEKLNQQAQASWDEATKLKADLQARLDRIKSAAA
jgi:hypothetical protein